MVQKIKVYHGYHSAELYELLKVSWQNETPVIICPPHLKTPDVSLLKIPENTILGLYTSGTLSGKPRLIFYSKKNIESSLSSIRSLYQTKKIDKIFCYPQPTHTFGLTLGYLHSIIYNIPIVFHEGVYSSASHQKWFCEVTEGLLTLGTPTHFIDLMNYLEKNSLTPANSYTAIVGGAPVSKKLWHQIQNQLRIAEPSIGYGATEASPGLLHLGPGIEPSVDGDIGAELPGVKLREVSESGFYFSGDNLCIGSIENGSIKAEQEIYIKDHLLKTRSGHFIFNGRSDLLINRGGLKLSPEMIEGALFSEFSCRAVCVSIYSERLTEDVGLVVEAMENEGSKIKAQITGYFKTKIGISIADENIVLAKIPLNANAKYDRIECIKLVLNQKKIPLPVTVEYFKPFLPHRSSAIWIHRIIQYDHKKATAEVDLDLSSHIFTKGKFRASACIELVAQTYAYGKTGFEISVMHELTSGNVKVTKTLIAEVRHADFSIDDKADERVTAAIEQKMPLTVEAICTHEFGLIKVIKGSVKLNDETLATLSLKAFVSPD